MVKWADATGSESVVALHNLECPELLLNFELKLNSKYKHKDIPVDNG